MNAPRLILPRIVTSCRYSTSNRTVVIAKCGLRIETQKPKLLRRSGRNPRYGDPPEADRLRDKGTAKTAVGGRRPGIAARRSWLAACKIRDWPRARRRPRRTPGMAVFRGRVLTTCGFEAASSRLPAAPAAYSPDLLGRGRHDGAIFFSLFFCQPASSGLSGPAAESCGGSPLEAGSRTTRQRGWGCRPVFLGLKGRG